MLGVIPENVSTYGVQIDHVFRLIIYLAGGWFILVEGLIIYWSIRYRRGASPKATYVRAETLRMAAWVLVPAAAVLLCDLGIDAAAHSAWDAAKIEMPAPDLEVLVTGKQFNWSFTYAGPDGKLGTADDVTISNELHVPVNKVVVVTLVSPDVIHGFFVPSLRLKQDAEPGHKIPQWFKATKIGAYDIECTELCGFGHYTMAGKVIVQSGPDYEQWLRKNVLEAGAGAAAGGGSK